MLDTFRVPLAVNVPPVRLKAPFSVEVVPGSFSVSEPPDTVTAPLSVALPATVSAPLETTSASFEYSCPATCPAALTVTVGLAAARSINTKSPATGATPPTQLGPTFQNPLVSTVQTLMPALLNVVSLRCKKNAPPTLPEA